MERPLLAQSGRSRNERLWDLLFGTKPKSLNGSAAFVIEWRAG